MQNVIVVLIVLGVIVGGLLLINGGKNDTAPKPEEAGREEAAAPEAPGTPEEPSPWERSHEERWSRVGIWEDTPSFEEMEVPLSVEAEEVLRSVELEFRRAAGRMDRGVDEVEEAIRGDYHEIVDAMIVELHNRVGRIPEEEDARFNEAVLELKKRLEAEGFVYR